MVTKLRNDLIEVKQPVDSKAELFLDATSQWEVKKTFKKVKLQIKDMIAGFATDEHFQKPINELFAAMDLIINIHNHIENYFEHKKILKFIANVSSVQADSSTDPELEQTTMNLKSLVKIYSMIEEYQMAVDALKQLVFPFAHEFLDRTELFKSINSTDNVDKVADEVSLEIDYMINHLNKFDHAHSFLEGPFGSQYEQEPFFM